VPFFRLKLNDLSKCRSADVRKNGLCLRLRKIVICLHPIPDLRRPDTHILKPGSKHRTDTSLSMQNATQSSPRHPKRLRSLGNRKTSRIDKFIC